MGNRVRIPRPFIEEFAMDAGGLPGLGTHLLLLDQFCENGRPKRSGFATVACLQQEGGYQLMHIKAKPESTLDGHRKRYEFLEKFGIGE